MARTTRKSLAAAASASTDSENDQAEIFHADSRRPSTPLRHAATATDADASGSGSSARVTTDAILAYLRRPHTITILMAVLGWLLWVALAVTDGDGDTVRNTKMYARVILCTMREIASLKRVLYLCRICVFY